jgi:hypothetical protein
MCLKGWVYANKDYVSQRESTMPNYIMEYIEAEHGKAPLQIFDNYFAEDKVCFPFLTDVKNKCLKLFYFDGLSYNQIAMRVNLPASKVKYQIYQAKRRIARVEGI